MRTQTRYQFQDVVDEAVTQTRQSFIDAGASTFAAPTPTTPPQSDTTPAIGDDGEIYTQYPAFTELDSTESGAVTA